MSETPDAAPSARASAPESERPAAPVHPVVPERARPLEVGLTGGIASGKSTVSARLRELGAVVVDADVLAREVVAPGTDGLVEVVAAFGEGVLGPDGALDRPALGAIVFADEAARRRLEGLTHPRIAALREVRTREAGAVGADVVVHDIPLLVEGGMADLFDLVLVVEAPAEVRVERMARERGMDAEAARARIAAQASDADRAAVADVVLANTGSREDLLAAVDAAWEGPIAAALGHGGAPAPVGTCGDREASLAFIAAMQSEPATACAYVGTLDEGLEEDLDGLDQPWLETLRVCRAADGSLTGAALLEWDEEVGMSWVHGPWVTPGTWDRDAPALLDAVVAQAPVGRHEMYAATANRAVARLARRRGWRASGIHRELRCDGPALAGLVGTRPPVGVEIRPIGPDDLAEVAELHAAEFPATYATAGQLTAAPYVTLVAIRGGRVVGYVTGQTQEDGTYLDFVAVAPGARRGGVGRALLGALARELPGESMRLTVGESNAVALGLYTASGWRIESATRAYRTQR